MRIEMLAQSFSWGALLRPDVAVPLGAFVVAIVAIGGSFWFRSIQEKRITDLKRAMIERGMSADEIERVIAANANPKRKRNLPPGDGGRAD